MTDFTYGGRYYPYAVTPKATRFLLETDLMENFDSAIMRIKADDFIDAPIWDHDQLYLERVWLWYKATDADTTITVFANSGFSPSTSVAPPIAYCPATIAGKYNVLDSGEMNIPINSSTAGQGPSTYTGIIIVEIDAHNAADDMSCMLQGWFSDLPPREKET